MSTDLSGELTSVFLYLRGGGAQGGQVSTFWNKRKKPPQQKAKDPKLIVPDYNLYYFKQKIKGALWDR